MAQAKLERSGPWVDLGGAVETAQHGVLHGLIELLDLTVSLRIAAGAVDEVHAG